MVRFDCQNDTEIDENLEMKRKPTQEISLRLRSTPKTCHTVRAFLEIFLLLLTREDEFDLDTAAKCCVLRLLGEDGRTRGRVKSKQVLMWGYYKQHGGSYDTSSTLVSGFQKKTVAIL